MAGIAHGKESWPRHPSQVILVPHLLPELLFHKFTATSQLPNSRSPCLPSETLSRNFSPSFLSTLHSLGCSELITPDFPAIASLTPSQSPPPASLSIHSHFSPPWLGMCIRFLGLLYRSTTSQVASSNRAVLSQGFGGWKFKIKGLVGPCSLGWLQGRILPCLFWRLLFANVPSHTLACGYITPVTWLSSLLRLLHHLLSVCLSLCPNLPFF